MVAYRAQVRCDVNFAEPDGIKTPVGQFLAPLMGLRFLYCNTTFRLEFDPFPTNLWGGRP